MSVLDGSIVPVGHMGLTIGADAAYKPAISQAPVTARAEELARPARNGTISRAQGPGP